MKEIHINTIALGVITIFPMFMLFASNWIRWLGIVWVFGIATMFILIFYQAQEDMVKSDLVCDCCQAEMEK